MKTHIITFTIIAIVVSLLTSFVAYKLYSQDAPTKVCSDYGTLTGRLEFDFSYPEYPFVKYYESDEWVRFIHTGECVAK